MDVRFCIDPETNLPHIHRHGLTKRKLRMYCSTPERIALETKVLGSQPVKRSEEGISGLSMFPIGRPTVSLSLQHTNSPACH